QEKRYDLIISDFLMPLMDGIELIQAIKKITPGILSIMLSGFTDLPYVLKAMKAEEISHYMTKPWDSEALKRTIAELLASSPTTSRNPFLSKQVHQEPTAAARTMSEMGDLEKLERKYPGITFGVWKAGQVF
ncbi:MAG: response regulator, partial [Nitrospiria bacterium]